MIPRLAAAQALPLGIPDLCSESPTIIPAGVTTTLVGQTMNAVCLGVHGTLIVDDSSLTVETLLVYPDGVLDVRGRSTITIQGALNTLIDPEQWGLGIVGLGRVRLAGTAKTAYVRLTAEARAKTTTLSLQQRPDGWEIGDELLIPDSRPFADGSRIEIRRVAAVTDTDVILDSPLSYDHPGWHTYTGSLDPAFLPHVANLTRTIVVRSADPSGERGHIVCAARVDCDIRFARFDDLGRTTTAVLDSTTFNKDGSVKHIGTNQIGRYAMHLHQLVGPGSTADGVRYRFIGNVVARSQKWALAVHNTHFGLATDNVVYDAQGAGITTEDGSETANVFERNFVVKVNGTGSRGDNRAPREFAFEGACFWFRGVSNYVRDNVCANAHTSNNNAYGYKLFQLYLATPGGTIRVPTAPGQEVADYVTVDPYTLPVREFARNEVYGSDYSLTYWWIGTANDSVRLDAPPSIIDSLRGWNVRTGISHYPAHNVHIEACELRGSLAAGNYTGSGYYAGDYLASDFSMRQCHIEGFPLGVHVSTVTRGPQLFESLALRNIVNVRLDTLWKAGAWPNNGPRLSIFRNLAHARWPSKVSVQGDYQMKYVTQGAVDLIQRNEARIETGTTVTYLYFTQQAPDFIVPEVRLNKDGSVQMTGSPVPGLTNAQTMALFGIAINGVVAPCTTTAPGVVNGFVCN